MRAAAAELDKHRNT